MDSPSPSVLALQRAQDITSRWSNGELGAAEAQHALKSLFDRWQPGTPENRVDEAAGNALSASRIAFHDWLQRGENCEELVTQLRWILDPTKDGSDDPALNAYAPRRPSSAQ